MKKNIGDGLKIVSLNRKARFNYFLLELLEAGIVLKGSEIKSIREGKINISDSYALDKAGELYLINSHIASYKQSSYNDHNPIADRKLLLKKKELNKIIGKIHQEGLTVVPTRIYLKKGKAKIEIALAKGKKLYDKRQTKKNRDWKREQSRILSKNK